jgi:adenine-specific DNA-methyltransferase
MSLEKNVIEEQSINEVNYELLKKQFPHAVSIDENGRYVIDPQKLQMSLDPSLAQIKEDGYGLNWVGKKEAYHNAFTKNYKVLKPLKDDSKNWDETENILIKGDNLDALKILRQNYFESIKMIYIDPPYNTKNDGFVYNDNFTTSTEQTLEELGYDKEYIDYIENIQGAKTHSGWLSFMYPRLLLAKDLLKDDGLIFISIDDNEVAQLRLLCNEIFAEENFVGEFIWQKASGNQNDSNSIAISHEYILCYCKSIEKLSLYNLPPTKEMLKTYNLEDEFVSTRGKHYLRNLNDFSIGDRPGLHYDIICPDGTILKGNEYRWRCDIHTFNWRIKENRIIFEKNVSGWQVFYKQYINETKEEIIKDKNGNILSYGKTADSLLLKIASTGDGKKDIKSIFGDAIFSYPKPVKLLNHLLKITTKDNDLILDFFAGSGATAHAVMDLNAQDNGNRKFICVQWAEKTPEKSEAKKAGYETIFDITKARIDKAGDQIAKGDIGFRTFEIVEDQKQKIYQKSLEEVNQDDLLSLMEKPDISSNEEILYNLFVAETLPLSTKHQELIKDKLYLASNVAFILGDITSDELVEALKDKKECEYITVYSPNISNDKFTLEIESNISKLGIKSDKLRFRG